MAEIIHRSKTIRLLSPGQCRVTVGAHPAAHGPPGDPAHPRGTPIAPFAQIGSRGQRRFAPISSPFRWAEVRSLQTSWRQARAVTEFANVVTLRRDQSAFPSDRPIAPACLLVSASSIASESVLQGGFTGMSCPTNLLPSVI